MQLASIGLVLAVAGTVMGATDPAVRCASRRERAAARLASDLLGCASDVARGRPFDPACTTRAHDRATAAYAAAATAGGCGLAGGFTAGTITAADGLAADVATAVNATPGGRCEAVKLDAAGRKAVAKLRCHSLPSAPTCLTHAEERFGRAFARAQARGDCTASGDAGAVEAAVDDYVDTIVTGRGCGNGAIDTGEACDGQPFCAADCSQVSLPFPTNGCCAIGGFCFGIGINDGSAAVCQQSGGVPSIADCVPDSDPPTAVPPLVAGQCVPLEFAATRYCCETAPNPACSDAVLSDGNGIYGFLFGCFSLGIDGRIVVGACGADGHCIPGT